MRLTESPGDKCGIFGVYGNPEATTLTYLGLYALQHRGQEGAGIVSWDGETMRAHRGVGLVADVFKPHRLANLTGDIAIGHVRYSTFGTNQLKNVQPLVADYARGSMAVCHNGNLVNAARLREKLEDEGAIFHSTTDTGVIIHLIARSKKKAIRGERDRGFGTSNRGLLDFGHKRGGTGSGTGSFGVQTVVAGPPWRRPRVG
ncbi:MAG: class II glutamine amidotransferase [Candidatus Hydrogenedentes bacterium]|nr:class II glutamine amidotransferase [Candidatus Hydrogenedentota bacterium]